MTVQKNRTIRRVLNGALPDNLPDALRKAKIGNMLSTVKVVATGLTAAASFDITTLAFKALSTITGIELESNEGLPPVGSVNALRVVASGTAGSLGAYIAGDVGATMIVPPGGAGVAVGIARLSDDGKTITFPNTVTAFTLIYRPAPAISLDSIFEPTT